MATAGAPEENWPLPANRLAAEAGEDGRSAGKTCPLLLATAGSEPSHAAAVCQNVGTDSWAVSSVGIAEAATAPKKTIPISSNNAEVSGKVGSGCRGGGLSGPGKGRKVADGTLWENKL